MSLVVFDLDGTLIDTVPAFEAAFQQAAMKEGGAALSTSGITRIVAEEATYRDMFRRMVEAVPESSRGGAVEEIAGRFEEALGETYPTRGKLYPGVYRLMMALEGEASCGIVGSASRPLLEAMVGYFGLDGYVGRLHSMTRDSASVAEAVTDWMHAASSPPEEVIWVSSRPVQLEIARAAGLPAAFAAYGYGNSPAWTPEHRLERVSGLFSVFL